MLSNFNHWVAALPAQVRHFAAAFLGSALAVVGAAVVSAGGVFGIDWTHTAETAVSAGVIAALATVAVFAVTPLTSSYGLKKDKNA